MHERSGGYRHVLAGGSPAPVLVTVHTARVNEQARGMGTTTRKLNNKGDKYAKIILSSSLGRLPNIRGCDDQERGARKSTYSCDGMDERAMGRGWFAPMLQIN